ncbi:MAG: hypothetical protein AVDCRST_MAG77-3591 [uncultured Chloroflexi bacterium]|uniref:HTH gntR-type domain-containing protein n=1 Tax=uncultured Chloroflexota bacterium TaxID=166587 RepID=A0A6J4JF67_9CHLR|nr:MAG: hypothetical protein AVDCRST_MAG77-3591 [uncultured Chloroflexota bacterium]
MVLHGVRESTLTSERLGVAGLLDPRPPAVPRRTTHLLVVDELRAMILGGTLEPGERLRIEDLAATFGVNPMPVREALHQLTAEGTVVLDPYRGFSIAHVSAAKAQDLYSTCA